MSRNPFSADSIQQVRVALWSQIAAGLNLGEDPERLAWFLALFDNLLTLDSEESLATYASGFDAAYAMFERLHAHDFARGVAFEHRRRCDASGVAVPDWVVRIEQQYAEAQAQLQAETRETQYRALLDAASDEAVH